MRIIVYSLGPVFPKLVHGGSQKVLADIARELGIRGHYVEIICPKRLDLDRSFMLAPNVKVNPLLEFRGSYPDPFFVSPFKLSRTLDKLKRKVTNFDLLYVHDAQLPFGTISEQIPTVISLRDFVYAETLLGAANFSGRALIVNSSHTYACCADTFGRIIPCITKRMHLIYNGYDASVFCPKRSSRRFLSLLGLSTEDREYIIIGFPHRPDLDKGFLDAVEALALILHKNFKARILIPEYIDKGISKRADNTYRLLRERVSNFDLEDAVLFHPWMPHDLMPEYYSFCDVVLCVGTFCEAFSNVSAESLLCGTPVVAANVACYRTIPFRQYLQLVEPGDTTAIAECILRAVRHNHERRFVDARRFVASHFSIKRCADCYEETFLAAVREPSSEPVARWINNDQCCSSHYHLAPWCRVVGNSLISDYGGSLECYELAHIFMDGPDTTREDLNCLEHHGVELKTALTEGFIIPGKSVGLPSDAWGPAL